MIMTQPQVCRSARSTRLKTATLAALTAILLSGFTVAPAQAGAATAGGVQHHASQSGRTDGVLASAQLLLTIPPVVSGTPNVGARFATTTGTWSPNSVTITFRWLADGVPIPGAIYSSYYPGAAEVGKRLTTVVTASKPGYATRTVSSEPSDPIRLGKARISPAPSITGEPKVGATLLGYGGTSSCCGLTLSLQWLRDGVAIPGATGETYSPVQGDVGRHIRLRLTVSAPGYIPTTATSAATSPVTAS